MRGLGNYKILGFVGPVGMLVFSGVLIKGSISGVHVLLLLKSKNVEKWFPGSLENSMNTKPPEFVFYPMLVAQHMLIQVNKRDTSSVQWRKSKYFKTDE